MSRVKRGVGVAAVHHFSIYPVNILSFSLSLSIQYYLSLSLSLSGLPSLSPSASSKRTFFILSGLLVLVGVGRAGIGSECISSGGALI